MPRVENRRRRGSPAARVIRVGAALFVAAAVQVAASQGSATGAVGPLRLQSVRGALSPWVVTVPGRLSALANDVAGDEQRLSDYRRQVQGLGGVNGVSLLRIDQAYEGQAGGGGLSEAIRGLRTRLDSTGERVQTLTRRIDSLGIDLDRQRRAAQALVASITAARFQHPGTSKDAEQQIVTARHILVRIMTLGHDAARLRADVAEVGGDLSRQERGPIGQLAGALSGAGTLDGVFLLCPVDAPRSYSDDFGYARAGHVHQGNDVLAPLGTPIRAPFPGVAAVASNSVGGMAVKVFGRLGWVYNAHLSALGTLGGVEAGTIVGYVGNSGNAAGGPTHDHFEWHPGGGGAVDPYPYLQQVC
jgi:murein DD-endopeptidase MepM/ murein hydrolase activator NlpD